MKAQKIASTGILAAMICVLSPFSIPAGTIPVSLATFAIYITACTVKTKISVSAVIIYILLGAMGLPVFSSFQGGFHILTGVTGGYIIGYIPCTIIIGLLVNRFEDKKFIYAVSLVLGTVACYAIGTLWYMIQTNSNFVSAISVCILPFIIGDIIKISAASALGFVLRKRIAGYKKTRS